MKKRLLFNSLLLIGLLSSVCAAPKATSSSANDWPTYQANVARTGYVPITIPSSQFHVIWKKQLINDPHETFNINNITCTENQLFVSAYSVYNEVNPPSYLLAVASNTGDIQWEKHFTNFDNISGASFYNGNIYVQTVTDTQGDINAYQASSGKLLFQLPFATEGGTNHLAPAVDNNTIYFSGGDGGGVYSYNIATHQQNWFNPVNYALDLTVWTPAIDNQYLLAYDIVRGYLYALDPKTGKILFKIQDPVPFAGFKEQTSPGLALDAQNNTAFTIHAHYLTAYDLDTKSILYNIYPYMGGQPDIANGVIYFLYGNNLLAIDEKTGHFDWEWTTDFDFFGIVSIYPMIVTNNVLFISSATNTYAISLTTHHTIWHFPVAGYLAINNNALFIVTKTGMAYAIGF